MHISIFQAILLGLLYYLTNNGTPWVTGLGSVSIRQPIVCGAITGLILGDVTQHRALSLVQQSTHCTLDSSTQVEHFRQMPVSVVS